MVSFVDGYERAWRAAEEPLALRRALLFELALVLTERAGFSVELLEQGRMARAPRPSVPAELRRAFLDFSAPAASTDRLALAHQLGQALDALLALEANFEASAERQQARRSSSLRKLVGSFFTPPDLARALVARSVPNLSALPPSLTVCDPAVGGGAFLLEAANALLASSCESEAGEAPGRRRIHESLHGWDRQELAIEVSEWALWLYLLADQEPLRPNPRLELRDSLEAPSFEAGRAEATATEAFDWIVGNPPWVAYQGRSARPLEPTLRARYRERYAAFRGFPTLHGMFVERACELAPNGIISLLLPSSVSDLDGYQPTRARLAASHRVLEPLEEFGQDAFAGVVQPCFGLIAAPRSSADPVAEGRPWTLQERSRRSHAARTVERPSALARLSALPPLPADLFGELGLQTNREVSRALLHRGPNPQPPFELPLLEGRRVREFRVSSPELFLHVDRPLLERTRCLLRDAQAYRAVDFVVRQTAAFPIAAPHTGAHFRNSLLAGYARHGYDLHLLLGLLNSALFRAVHVAGQRDARQAAFPQVKVSHLRRLPAPPPDEAGREQVRRIARRASEQAGLEVASREELDRAVFALFGISEEEARSILAYLSERAPGALSAREPRAAD
ncbi:MAG TPA: N-6 DNA methylase [Polyangiaceae bacterium]|nr:N-6 DNA methylase [Polyangiaceae bacterium]